MKLLTRYLMQPILWGILFALLLVLSIDTLFSLVNELRYIGRGDYRLAEAVLYILLTLPQKIYQFFPMAALLGTMVGLGTLAQRSELIIMRVTGWSILDIARIVLSLGLGLAVLAWGLGEVIAPYADNYAHQRRASVISGGQALQTDQGTWMRDGTDFVHIRAIDMQGTLQGVTRYQFSDDFQLECASYAQTAEYQTDHWQLHNIEQTCLTAHQTETQSHTTQTWESVIQPEILQVLGMHKVEHLSLLGLWRTIQYRQANGLDYTSLGLAFWAKWIQPLTTITMMLMAIPFIFGPLRQSSMGLKMLTGIMIGFSFHTANSLLGPLLVVYQFPAWLGAILPTTLFLGLGVYMMRKMI